DPRARLEPGVVALERGEHRLVARARGLARGARARLHPGPVARCGHGACGSYFQGIRDAWITSGTPWPPTERIARPTSFNPKAWVVIFSSGKRLEASCCSASSQAL